MQKKLAIWGLALASFAVLFVGSYAQAASSSELKCQNAMHKSYGGKVDSVASSVSKMEASLNSLVSAGTTIDPSIMASFNAIKTKLNTLALANEDLLNTADSDGKDCLSGNGQVHEKAVSVNAQISSITDGLKAINNYLRSKTSIAKSQVEFDKIIANMTRLSGNVDSAISSAGSKATDAVLAKQTYLHTALTNYKAIIEKLREIVVLSSANADSMSSIFGGSSMSQNEVVKLGKSYSQSFVTLQVKVKQDLKKMGIVVN